ncbi:MAG: hypothetical protein EB090_01170 [Verrucomicrobia bacterium]|nr:hypothetical protein [Verrucomicrobiota bacterium]
MASFPRRVILDIGASVIRIGEVLSDRKGGIILRQLKSLELGIDPTKPTEIFPAVLQHLDALFKSSGIKPGLATLCLGGPSVFSRVIKVPQTDPTQVKQMVGYEAQQAIPAIEEACWDFQLFPAGSGNELEAMILAIKKDSVEEMMVAATKAGLLVDCVELAPAAIINAFRYNYPENQASTLILEIGARATNIVLVEGSKIFCRIVPLGGATVTQSIATDLQESFVGAETLKKAKGFVHPGGSYEDPPDENAGRICKLARGVITRLHNEVERSITFFRSQQGGSRPTQLLLAGGGAELVLMDFFFREKLKIPVSYFQSFRRMSVEGLAKGEIQKNAPSWTCFVGTALRSLPDTPCRFSVMDQLKNQSAAKAKDRPAMLTVYLAAAVLLSLPGVHGFWQASKTDSVITSQNEEVEQAESLALQMQSEQKKVAEQIVELSAAQELEEERLRWPKLLDELAKKSKPGMWITKLSTFSGSVESTDSASKRKGGVSELSTPAKIEISGLFETKSEEADAQVIDHFVKSLQEGGLLRKIETIERETPERSADGIAEQVALRFTLRAEWVSEPTVSSKSGPGSKPK